MPQSTLDFSRYLTLTAAPSVPLLRGQVLYAQLGPDAGVDASAMDGGPRDAGVPETATDAPDAGLPLPTPPPVAAPPPMRIPLAEIGPARVERDRLLSDSSLVGATHLTAYQAASGTTYRTLFDAIAEIRWYVEGTHADLFTSRPPILAWLRAVRGSTDSVMQDSLGNILAALNGMTNRWNQPRAQAMAQMIQSIQQLLTTPAPAAPPAEAAPPPAAAVPAAPPPPASSGGSSSSGGASTASLRRRAERTLTAADTACAGAASTSDACRTARRTSLRAATAYRRAICEESPRSAACTTARTAETTARTAVPAAASGGGGGEAGGGGPPPPPDLSGGGGSGH